MNNRTNKFLSLLLAITLVFASLGLAACGGQQKQEQDAARAESVNAIQEEYEKDMQTTKTRFSACLAASLSTQLTFKGKQIPTAWCFATRAANE